MVKVATRRETRRKAIAKPGSFLNLEQCIQQLSMEQSQITAKTAIAGVHQLCKAKRKLILKIRKQATAILKICRVCDKWNEAKSIITCENCDDHYHKKCYQKEHKSHLTQAFICHLCLNDALPLKKCQFCQKKFNRGEKVDVCKSCHYQYHKKCFSKDIQSCNRCAKLVKSIKNDARHNFSQLKIQDMFEMIEKKNISKTSKLNHLVEGKGVKFVASKLLIKENMIEKYKRQLLEAIQLKNMNYTEYLVDLNGYLSNISSQSMDFGLTNMSKAEQKQYVQYKSQPIGPFCFSNSIERGVDVVADMDIPQYSIICEYIGQVLTLRKCIELEKIHKNDSVMDLWIGKNSEKSLVICPKKWTNVARFLNGVGKRKEQKNVNSIKICFKGKPLILLVASRKIKKGQSLCYDYNGGNQAKYPTDSFV